jgi:hypothetical protein
MAEIEKVRERRKGLDQYDDIELRKQQVPTGNGMRRQRTISITIKEARSLFGITLHSTSSYLSFCLLNTSQHENASSECRF